MYQLINKMVVLSDETKKTRDSIIGKLQKQFNTTGLSFLSNAERIVKHIETTPTARGKLPAHSSIKTTISTIKSVLRDNDLPHSQYDEYLNKYAKEQKSTEEEQSKSQAQDKNWLEWNQVLEAVSEIPKNTQKHLIASLYTMIPPNRLDYTPMRWKNSRKPKTTDENYIVVSKSGKHTFVINKYKTAESYGQITYKATPELDAVLNEWRLNHPDDDYLLMTKSEPMTANALGQAVREIFKQYAGIPATVNILRHSYDTHIRKDELPLKTKQKIAKQMGHSVKQAELYRKI
jgi:hypothetical protein